MIYYNRAIDLLGDHRFAAAAAANAVALRLDPQSATIRGNLLATVNNWAIDLAAAAYREAADLLRRGLSLDPGYETFTVNYAHVYRQWIRAATEAGRLAEADLLTRQARQSPSSSGRGPG